MQYLGKNPKRQGSFQHNLGRPDDFNVDATLAENRGFTAGSNFTFMRWVRRVKLLGDEYEGENETTGKT